MSNKKNYTGKKGILDKIIDNIKEHLEKNKRKIIITGVAGIGLGLTVTALTKAYQRFEQYDANNVGKIAAGYVDDLEERIPAIEAAKRVAERKYNDLNGTNFKISLKKLDGKNDGFRISDLEIDGNEYHVIYKTEKEGQGSIIEYKVFDKEGNCVKTYYESENLEGKPVYTIDTATLAEVLKGNEEPDKFESEIIPELHEMMECALECGDAEFSKEFKEKLVKYLTEQGIEAVTSGVKKEYGDLLALTPSSEQWLEITEEDVTLIEDYYASNFGGTSTIIDNLKREHLKHLDDPEDWKKLVNAVEEWVNSGSKEADQVKEHLRKVKEEKVER